MLTEIKIDAAFALGLAQFLALTFAEIPGFITTMLKNWLEKFGSSSS
ncbi:MAG: hypothetical protein WDN00_07715 [Limisphaerales bacterium]